MASLHSWPSNYFASKQAFVEQATVCGAHLSTRQLDAVGPNGKPLTVDIASFISPTDVKRIFLLSGLHGVEGFLGAATQIQALQFVAQQGLPDKTGVVMVHGVNPWGFAHLRRVDENNVDLNRNFFDFIAEKPTPNTSYCKISPIINPETEPDWFSELAYWCKACHLIVTNGGVKKLAGPIAQGQMEIPKGLFFTGTQSSPSSALLQNILLEATRSTNEVIILDVHSGLGRSGVATLITNTNMQEAANAQGWLEKHYGQSVAMDYQQNNPYNAQGSLSRWCAASLSKKRFLYHCVEIGTVGPVKVLTALKRENQAHHWAHPDSRQYLQTKQALLDAFAPASTRWRNAAAAEVLHAFKRSLSLPAPIGSN